ERPSLRSASRWFGTRSRVFVNQKPETPVSTRPLSGISVGRMTSKVEMRSLATRSRRSSSSAYSSRTFPLPRCVAASGMNGFLLRNEAADTVEGAVEMGDRRVQVEDGGESGVVETRADLAVGANELGEVAFLVPRLHGVALHELVRLRAIQAALDQRKQQPVREEEPVRGPEVPLHPFRIDDQALDDPGKAVEHVVDREKRIGDHHALRGRV